MSHIGDIIRCSQTHYRGAWETKLLTQFNQTSLFCAKADFHQLVKIPQKLKSYGMLRNLSLVWSSLAVFLFYFLTHRSVRSDNLVIYILKIFQQTGQL